MVWYKNSKGEVEVNTYSSVVTFIESHKVHNVLPMVSDITPEYIAIVDYNNNIFALPFANGKNDKQLDKFIKTLEKYAFTCQNCGRYTYPPVTKISHNEFSIMDIKQTIYDSLERKEERFTICQNCSLSEWESLASKFVRDPDNRCMFEEYHEINVKMDKRGKSKTTKRWVNMCMMIGVQNAAKYIND